MAEDDFLKAVRFFFMLRWSNGSPLGIVLYICRGECSLSTSFIVVPQLFFSQRYLPLLYLPLHFFLKSFPLMITYLTRFRFYILSPVSIVSSGIDIFSLFLPSTHTWPQRSLSTCASTPKNYRTFANFLHLFFSCFTQ